MMDLKEFELQTQRCNKYNNLITRIGLIEGLIVRYDREATKVYISDGSYDSPLDLGSSAEVRHAAQNLLRTRVRQLYKQAQEV